MHSQAGEDGTGCECAFGSNFKLFVYLPVGSGNRETQVAGSV